MSDSMLVCGFLFLVFAPCLVALLAGGFADGSYMDVLYVDKLQLPRRRGAQPTALQAMLPELALAEDFAIRSFPKGLSQRRIVVRDTESGIKLTIAQVRAAAIELVKLGGVAAAYEFALVAAASAAAMTSVKNAFALAARDAMEAARNAYAWLAWGDAMTQELSPPNFFENGFQTEAPPRFAPAAVDVPRWREASQAA